jgi:hypothetical protein
MRHPLIASSTAAKRFCGPHCRYLTNGHTRVPSVILAELTGQSSGRFGGGSKELRPLFRHVGVTKRNNRLHSAAARGSIAQFNRSPSAGLVRASSATAARMRFHTATPSVLPPANSSSARRAGPIATPGPCRFTKRLAARYMSRLSIIRVGYHSVEKKNAVTTDATVVIATHVAGSAIAAFQAMLEIMLVLLLSRSKIFAATSAGHLP